MLQDQTYTLLLIFAAAALLPVVSRLVRLPNPVLEILLGMILGKSLLGVEVDGEWLPFLAELGFLLLMFHAGMEIDFSMLRTQRQGLLLMHLVLFGLTFGLAFLFSGFLGHGLFMALVLSTTSLGLVMPTLKEAGLTRSPLGQTILIAATLADFLTLLGITFFILWSQYGLSWRLFYPVPLFFGFGLILRLARLWAWWNPERVERLLGAEDPQESGVRLSLALLFLFVVFSNLVHLEPVLGAFLGGCVISYVFRDIGFLEGKLSALGFGFLIPIFFIHVGMEFDLSHVLSWDRMSFALKLLGLALAVKILPSLLFTTQGAGFWNSMKAGVILSTRLSLIVAAASIGVAQGMLTPETKDSVVLLAVITCLLGPTLFKIMSR